MAKVPVLQVRNVSKHFGGTQALSKVSMSVERGEIHALIGLNGSGKSTLIKLIMGVFKIDEGDFVYKNEPIRITDPIHAQRMGIGAIYQEPTLIPYFNALENIYLGHEICRNRLGQLDKGKILENVKRILRDFDISFPLTEPVMNLGVGQKRIIEVAKVLSLNSELILVDEATAGMHEDEIDHFFKILRTLKTKKITVVYVSHYLEYIFRIADRVSILRDGEYVDTMNIPETTVKELIPKMLGYTISDQLYPKKTGHRGECLFEIENLQHGKLLRDVNFKIFGGEVLGITGLMGAGKTELARTLYGIDCKKSQGTLSTRNGQTLNLARCGINRNAGIVYLPEERKSQSIYPKLDVFHNTCLGNMNSFSGRVLGHFKKKKARKSCDSVIKSMHVLVEKTDQQINQLSGGNQQKLVIGKLISSEPKLFLLDEPTRGIDVGTKVDIYKKIRGIVTENTAAVVFSSDIDELVGLCDRIVVLYKGKIFKQLQEEEITKDNVLFYSMGGEHAK